MKLNMIKVLHVLQGMNAGGMETLIMNYYRNIDRKKYQFDFLINDKEKCFFEDEINQLGGKIYRTTLPKENIIKNRKELNHFFKTNHYDVIHCHQGITYYYPIKMAKKYGIQNRIIHNHGINRNFLKYLFAYNELWAKKRICHYANNYISCSNTVLNHLFTNTVIKKKKHLILPNSIDTEKYVFNIKERKKIRSLYKIKEDEILFIHIGTFTKPKNHIFLIDIFSNLFKKNNNIKLMLVGEGPLKDEIISYIKNKRIENNVILTGKMNNIEKLLSAADIMLFPSLYEGLPLTLIEAQASGIKILASKNISKESKLTRNIKFLNIDSPKEWIENISKIDFDYDRKKDNIILNNSNFNIKKSVKTLEKIYNEKIEENYDNNINTNI